MATAREVADLGVKFRLELDKLDQLKSEKQRLQDALAAVNSQIQNQQPIVDAARQALKAAV